MAKNNIWKKLLPVLTLAMVSIVIGVTGATILHNLTMENPIKTPTVESHIDEELAGGAKKVKFTNTGKADVFLRIAYTETWTYTDPETRRTLLLPNVAEGKDGKSYHVALPAWKDTGKWSLDTKEGWLYYNEVLKTGDSTPLIVERVDFLGTGENPEVPLEALVDGEKYRNAAYEIHFTIEVVQASDEKAVSVDAVKKLFKQDLSKVLAVKADGTVDKGQEIQWPDMDKWNPNSIQSSKSNQG